MLYLIPFFKGNKTLTSMTNAGQSIILAYVAANYYPNLAYINNISIISYMITDLLTGYFKPGFFVRKSDIYHHWISLIQAVICLPYRIETMYCSKFIGILEVSSIFMHLYQQAGKGTIPYIYERHKNIYGLLFILSFCIMRFPVLTYYIIPYLRDENVNKIMMPLIICGYVLNSYWTYLIIKKAMSIAIKKD